MVDDTLLSAQQLTRYHHGRRVLHGIDLELCRGEVLGFLGPNGAGKSTTMNILAGVLAPHAGRVAVCGHDISRQPLQAKRNIGYLPELPPLHLDATVDEFLLFSARLHGLSARDAPDAVNESKRECELQEVGARLIANLSKGFRQRVGIAQAILHRPAVVILDEPTSGLDPNQIRSVRVMLQRLMQRHAVILSTHVLSEVQTLCNRVVILHHGQIAFNQAIDADNTDMHLRFAPASAPPNLRNIDGVHAVSALSGNHFRLSVSDFDSVADSIGQLAAEHEWGLREMYRDISPLEQVFVDLTCNDNESAA